MFWNKKHFYHLMIRSSSYPSEFEEVVQNTGQDLARKGKYVFFPQFPLFQFQFLKKKWFVKYLSQFFLPQGSDFYTCDRCGGPNIIVDFGSTVFMISSWYAAFLSIFQFSNMKKVLIFDWLLKKWTFCPNFHLMSYNLNHPISIFVELWKVSDSITDIFTT